MRGALEYFKVTTGALDKFLETSFTYDNASDQQHSICNICTKTNEWKSVEGNHC